MRENQPHESAVIQRSLVYEVLAVSILGAFGVELLAAIALDNFRSHERTLTLAGMACIIVSVVYVGWRAYLRLNTSSEFFGVFLAGEKNEPIEIPRYDLTEDLTQFIHGLCAENPAIGKLWQSPLGRRTVNNKLQDAHESQSGQLLIEAIEYFFLNQLSLHLSGHFENNEQVSEDELISISAADIPGVLLKNRFLSTFSRSMEERVPFMNSGDAPTFGEVVFATGDGGAIFDQFELILPRGTKVERTGAGSLHIITRRFTLAVDVNFEGFNTHIDNQFVRFYIHRVPFSFQSYAVSLSLSIRLKPLAMLSRKGWEYYRWRETFVACMEDAFSFERFKDHIGWETARTIAIMRPLREQPPSNKNTGHGTQKKGSIVKVSGSD